MSESATEEMNRKLFDRENPAQPRRGRFTVMAAAICAVFLALFLYSGPARAIGNFCPSGTCDITDPVYVNVYWDDSVDKWNTDIAQSDPSATVARIDVLTQALAHSQYFAGLAQYSVTSVTVAQSIVANGCGAPPANIDQAFAQMNTFAGCIFTAHPTFIPGQTILNVFLPPQVVPASATAEYCKTANANHDQYLYPVGFADDQIVYAFVQVAIIPTNIACNKSLTSVLELTTHEMVEAATDPVPFSPTGWKNFGTEIADACEHTKAKNAPFLFGRVSTYFSNATNGCVAFPVSPLSVASSKVCGSGSNMTMTLTGAFGDVHSGAPWDLTTTPAAYPAPASSSTIYLQAVVSGSHAWSAGNVMGFPPDIVSLGKITWKAVGGSGDTIVINGFDSHYGVAAPSPGLTSTVSPGDKVTLTISSQDTGRLIKTTLIVPGPSNVNGLAFLNPLIHLTNGSPPAEIFFGDHPTAVTGTLVDTGGCAIQNVAVTVSSSDPSATTAQGTTAPDGSFAIPYQLGGHAGKHTIKVVSPVVAQTTVSIHPVAGSLSATVGARAGNQPVTLSGAGFAAGVTSVIFRNGANSVLATGVAVPDLNTVSFFTPASPASATGVFQVVAAIDGVESVPLAYRYIVPNQPVLSIATSPSCPSDTTVLKVDAYNADGTAKAEQVNLTATAAVFLTSTGAHSSTSVASGGSAPLEAPIAQVTITATPAGNTSAQAQQKFALGTPGSHCVPIMAQALPFQIDPTGPIQSVSLPALAGQDHRSVLWAPRATFIQASHYMTSTGPGAVRTATATADLEVRDVGSRDLGAAISAHAGVNLRRDSVVAHVRFLGPGLSLESKTRQVADVTGAGLVVSFPVAKRSAASSYHILLLAPDATAWSEQTSSIDNLEDTSMIRASITGHGLYALAEDVD
jgi:hypothetical protein